MLKKVLYTIGILLMVTLSTGCQPNAHESHDEQQLRLGKECFDAGGEWVFEKGDWHTTAREYCKFTQDKKE